MIITIDGPVASGKSTVARLLAQKLGMYYLDTGLLYRAVAYVLLQRGISPTEGGTITKSDIMFISELSYGYEGGEPRICFAGDDITGYLRHSSLSVLASMVSAIGVVREALLSVQRDLGIRYDLVADGRDCGSVVFPHADFKFYLTAAIAMRARRLLLDVKRGGIEDLAAAKVAIEARDKRDMERDVAPLRVPDGAITIDNSFFTIYETVAQMLARIKGT